MAENYTLRTAAFKSTSAEIRNINVTNVDVKNIEVENLKIKSGDTYQNVTEMITDRGGLTVGYGDDLVTPGAVPDDGIIEGGIKLAGINFRGTHVMMVPKEDGTADLWFGPNSNPPAFTKITDVTGETKFVFASGAEPAAYDIQGITPGGTHDKVNTTTAVEEILLNDHEVMTVTEPTSLIVRVTTGNNTVHTAETSVAADGTIAEVQTAPGITITLSGPEGETKAAVNNTEEDADKGFTPGFMRCKAKVTINNATICPEGGTYRAEVSFAGVTKSTTALFTYKPYALVAGDKPVVTATYTGSTAKRMVSGVTYDNGGTINVSVTDIKNTQKMVAASIKRVTLSVDDNETGMVNVFPNDGDVNVEQLTLTSGEMVKDNAVFMYNTITQVTSDAPAKLECTIGASPYGQDGLHTNASYGFTTVSSENAWVWSGVVDDTDLVTSFSSEATRRFAVLSDITAAAGSVSVFDSTRSLATDYDTQLLVQGGKLKYPNSDITGTYTGLTGTRYYVRPVAFAGADQINTITVNVADGMATEFNNGVVRLYLAKKGVADAMVLNWYKKAECAVGKPIADTTAATEGTWACTVDNDVFQINGGVADTYYLVVEMLGEAEIGAITLS